MLRVLPFIILLTSSLNAQFLWHKVEENTTISNITYTTTDRGIFTSTYRDSNITGSKFVRDAGENRSDTYFEIYPTIEVAQNITITLDAYIDLPTSEITSGPKNIRLYFENTTNDVIFFEEVNLVEGQKWESLIFTIDQTKFKSKGLKSGGYNRIYLGFGYGNSFPTEVTYYINKIYGSIELNTSQNSKWVKGSWGGRLYVRGGEDLDTFVTNNYDYVSGAQEIVTKFPTMGHVITNATNNARSHLWTLRNNPNVDIVMGAENSIVDEEFVPSLENEQIIIDVINVFKQGGKKVILYLNSLSPADRASTNGAIAWNNYVNTYFGGNGHKAWMNYCEGYIKRFTELGVDGYWVDAFGSYNKNVTTPDIVSTLSEKDEFIQMIRDAAPNVSIASNFEKDYFEITDGEFLRVNSDGENDSNPDRYNIIKMAANDPWSDFTAGHITPLATGAPPNSWAYEEFTVTDIEQESISTFGGIQGAEGGNTAIKHMFLPIRETWSTATRTIVYSKEQAYRFVKRITDSGGSVTFSNTILNDGTITSDEVTILEHINKEFEAKNNHTPYVRPTGASLVKEILLNKSETTLFSDEHIIYPNPVTSYFTISNEFETLSIYGLMGKKVLDLIEYKKDIDISHIQNGIYLLRTTNKDNKTQTIKLVKE